MDTTVDLVRSDMRHAQPQQVRDVVRSGRWSGVTHGMARGFVHANLAIVPLAHAFDFLHFCLRNPKPCPLIEVLDPGDPVPKSCAQGADITTDLSKYRVFRNGELVEEVPDLRRHWRDDHVGFLLGCSLSFDQAMLDAGIPLRHLLDDGGRISVYRSNIPCMPAGIFKGDMIVSMRPIPRKHLVATIETTARYPIAHGAPVHVGNPADIGIHDMTQVYSGRYNEVGEDEVPVFWACGVTPQAIALASGVSEMITHSSGHMFMTDLSLAQIAGAR